MIDVGSGDGVKVGNPVVNGDGLIGRVSAVTARPSQVTLISRPLEQISVRIVPPGCRGS